MKQARVLLCLVVCLGVIAPLAIAPSASGARRGKAGVVVIHSDGSPKKVECVRISSRGILVMDLLSRSSLEYLTHHHPDFGRGICWLDGEGDLPPLNCNDVPGPTNLRTGFWGQWVQKRGVVGFASSGIETQRIRPGQVFILQWDPDDPTTEDDDLDFAPVPGVESLSDICAS